MNNKYIYIIVGIVILFVIVLMYQQSQNNKTKLAAQQALLAQNPNAQFTNNQGWFQLASALVGGLAAGVASNATKPKGEGE